MVGRVYDGAKWEDATVDNGSPPPIEGKAGEGGNNGEIFVSVVSFRDGARCGRTLKNLFDNAADPTKVIAGVVEQNDKKDKKCLAEYCKLQVPDVAKNLRGTKEELDAAMAVGSPLLKAKCPHYDRIRYIAVFDIAAKGPSYARSLTRKILGNEEFCMQVDSHSDFTKHWDEAAREEWRKVGNEFGMLSNQPAKLEEKAEREPGGIKAGEVPRQCHVQIGQYEGIPLYDNPADGFARDLDGPLLSRTWSAGFSFAKCHLEEAVPYDNFAPQLFDAEQFPRFVRFWTRGYDSYTPTRNIVYHDFSPNPEGVDPLNWAAKGYPNPKTQRQRALKRVKTLLGIPGGDGGPKAMANLGLYSVGRRRTMGQLEEFAGIDLKTKRGNSDNKRCGTLRYVPYDASISPFDNLRDDPDDLDPQPEYPLRRAAARRAGDGGGGGGGELPGAAGDGGGGGDGFNPPAPLDARRARAALGRSAGTDDRADAAAASSPAGTLLVLWLFGLFVWHAVFVGGAASPSSASPKQRSSAKQGAARRGRRAAAAGGAKDH